MMKKMDMSITPKAHVMFHDAVEQMKDIPGGIADKIEDWAEM